MRAAARAILDEAARDPGKVNALEAPLGAAPDTIPAAWTSEHVGKRIVEAFETLILLPPVKGPRGLGNHWPDYLYDRGDLNAQETLNEREKARRKFEKNVTVLRATSEQIRRMEMVLGWLSELHVAAPDLCLVVQRWGYLRALGRSVKEECRQKRISFQRLYEARNKAVAMIVKQIAGTPVW